LSGKHSRELVRLANLENLVLETNFSYLHSPTIQEIKGSLELISPIYGVESYIDGFGNFYKGEDVYSVHCPHVVAVSAYLFPEETFEISTKNLVLSKEGTVDVGIIEMQSANATHLHHSSLRGIKKERKIVFFGERGTIEYDATADNQYKLVTFEPGATGLIQGSLIEKSFNEKDNLLKSLAKLKQCILGESQPNTAIGIKVSDLLEQITPQKKLMRI